METVCSYCGNDLPRGNARFCNNCGMLVPDDLLSPHARTATQKDMPANKNVQAGNNEQVAQQPAVAQPQPGTPNVSPRSAKQGQDTSNVTPWLGIQGQNVPNATPWLGIQGQDVPNATPWLGIQGYDAPSTPPVAKSEKPASPVRDPAQQAQQGFHQATSTPDVKPESVVPSQKPEGPSAAGDPKKPLSAPSRPVAGATPPPRRIGGNSRLTRKSVSDQSAAEVAWPAPMTHVASAEAQPKSPDSAKQPDFPVIPTTPPLARDLRVKVWNTEAEAAPVELSSAAAKVGPEEVHIPAQVDEKNVEDMPTRAFSYNPASQAPAKPVDDFPDLPTTPFLTAPAQPQGQAEKRDREQQAADFQDIDQMPTSQLQSQLAPASSPGTIRPEVVRRDISSPGVAGQTPFAAKAPVQDSMRPQPVQPMQAPLTGSAASAAPQSQPGIGYPSAPSRPSRPNNRSLLFAAIAACLILLVGVGSWLLLAQPFSVSADTNPLQTVTNATVGASITYPTSWKESHTATTLTFADSSNTGQMKLEMSEASGGDQAKYLQQQATKLGMADGKAGPAVTFADTTWQQMHGSFLIMGANYVGTIYVSTHNEHVYALTQMAPKSTFADEESLIFAPMRSSLHFR